MKHSPFIVTNYDFKSVKEDNPEYYEVEGYASVYGNTDSYRDIVVAGAFAKDLMENGNERPILWQHNMTEPIGVGIFEEKGEAGLFVKIKMPKSDSFVKERVMPQIKCGAVKGLSIGYWTVIDEYDRNQNVNLLKECKLRETSCVTFPANSLAQITAAKQFLGIEEDTQEIKMYKIADEKTEWNEAEAIENIKENTDSLEAPSKHYKKGFLKVDEDNEKSFSAYTLPYAIYKSGEFQIVPKAVEGIAAGMISGRIKSDLAMKNFVNTVYKKRGKEEPFKIGGKCFIDNATLKAMEKSDIVAVLDSDNIIFSTNAKEMIAGALRSQEVGGSVDSSGDDLLTALKELNKNL